MLKSKYLLSLSIFLNFLNCFPNQIFAGSTDTLFASSLHPFGRYAITENKNLEMISSAVYFDFQFTGPACSIFAFVSDPDGHNYLQYAVDDVYYKKIKVSGNKSQPYNIVGLDKGKHTIRIFKATEATTGPIYIEKISGNEIKSLKIRNLPVIEFIGNSITCGAASDPSEHPCGTGEYHDQHNAYHAYGPRVARALHTNFIVSGVSGIGIYRSWNTPEPSMPNVYEKTDFLQNSQRNWDFTQYQPRIVSIALGTNDLSEGDHLHQRPAFDSAVFVSGYIRFVQLIKSKYPKARIVLLSSPMMNGDKRLLLQNCLTAVKTNIDLKFPGDKTVALYFFKPMQARGCGGHPSVEDHRILAEELTPFFKKLL